MTYKIVTSVVIEGAGASAPTIVAEPSNQRKSRLKKVIAEAGAPLSPAVARSPRKEPTLQSVDTATANTRVVSETKPCLQPEAASSIPPRAVRRRRTGRSAQLNLKVRQDTIEKFYTIADKHGWGLGEAFEKAVELLAGHGNSANFSADPR